MGTGWNVPTCHPLIHAHAWPSGKTAVTYGELGWPSRSEQYWYFEAE